MPRMRRDACKRQSEVGLHRDLSDFETVAILRFGVSNEPLDRRMHSRTGVKTEDSRVDFSRQEEKGPPGLGDVSFKIGSKVGTVVQFLEYGSLESTRDLGRSVPFSIRIVPVLITSMWASSGAEAGLVCHAGSLLARTSIVGLPSLLIGLPLGSLLSVQPDRLDGGGLRQSVQLFREGNQRKAGLVRRTDQIERSRR